jgi:ABC-type sugar transport system permease subunit
MGFDLTAVQVLILTWVLVSLWLGVRVPATLLLLPKKKVRGGVKVAGVAATALLWPLFVIAFVVSLFYELMRSVKKGKMKW